MNPGPPTAGERALGAVFLGLWRLVGMLAWALSLVWPPLRRHMWGVPVPEPGWTWVHGASAGEHRAAMALVDLLPEGAWRTTISMRTPVAGAFPAPLDVPGVIGPWLDRARPGRLVLVEGELWPGWLHACRTRGIPVVVVNARRRSSRARWGPLRRWLLEDVQFIRQDDVGDLKLEAQIPRAHPPLRPGAVVGCSTRPGDEARLVDGWLQLQVPRPPLVLAPRHLRRVPEVVALLRARGLCPGLRSKAENQHDVLVVDTLGELGGLLPGAGLAFIGGTFTADIGGHSPAEAVLAGLPIVHGPEVHNNAVAFAAANGTPCTASTIGNALQHAIDSGPRPRYPGRATAETVRRLPPRQVPPERPARPLLAPFVPVVRAIASRRPAWCGRPVSVPTPVISVGGLSAGGCGKTPVAGWLAARLDGAWVLARGHRRSPEGPDLRVGLPGKAPVHDLGDELEMLRRRGIPVVSCPDRVAAAHVAIEHGATVLILDDGFQHRRLGRDVDVVCLDGRSPRGRGPMPVGTAREPWSALGRADVLWVHNPVVPGDPWLAQLPDRLRVHSRSVPDHWRVGGATAALDAVQGTVDVAAGIAHPEGLVCALLRMELTIGTVHRSPNHRPAPVLHPGWVVTEKDAARLPPGASVRTLMCRLDVQDTRPLRSLLHHRLGVQLR